MAETARRGLGRGLSALLGEADPSRDAPAAGEVQNASREAPIELLRRNPDQPRRNFAEAELEELAASIREHGVLQPILVRPAPGAPGEFQIVAGERRWRAAQRANLHTVPIVVRTLDDAEVAEIAVVENVQRADLNPLEEAHGYHVLLERFGRTQGGSPEPSSTANSACVRRRPWRARPASGRPAHVSAWRRPSPRTPTRTPWSRT